MKTPNSILILFTLFIPSVALAESIAVKQTNDLLRGDYAIYDYEKRSKVDANSILAAVTVGIGQYGGASGILGYRKYNYKDLNRDSDSSVYGELLFLRDASFG